MKHLSLHCKIEYDDFIFGMSFLVTKEGSSFIYVTTRSRNIISW